MGKEEPRVSQDPCGPGPVLGTYWIFKAVSYYAAIARPLQERRTFLYQKAKSNNGSSAKHKFTAVRLRLEQPTPKELNAYHQLQKMFARPTMLHYHDPKRRLYVDLDASKEWGLAAHVYHVKEDHLRKDSEENMDHSKQKSLRPILFMSRQLRPAKVNFNIILDTGYHHQVSI